MLLCVLLWLTLVGISPSEHHCLLSEYPRKYKSIGQVKQKQFAKIAVIFLSISLNMCFGFSKEPSHRDGSFEYPQHALVEK